MSCGSRSLRANGVLFAWQLDHASPGDWERVDADIGLRMAVRAELASPTLAPAAAVPAAAIWPVKRPARRAKFRV